MNLELNMRSQFARRKSIISLYGSVLDSPIFASSPTSTAWPTADKAFFYPIVINETVKINKFWWHNGATVNASYLFDCGIWAANANDPITGTLLASTGSTAQGTASVVQAAAPTATTYQIGPGQYWLGLTCSNVLATVQAGVAGTAAIWSILGGKIKTSATIPLSTSFPTITLATMDAVFMPLFGIQVDQLTVY